MNLLSPAEIAEAYTALGEGKTRTPAVKLLGLSALVGALIALGAAAANTATFGLGNPSLVRLISGLLFPIGLGMVMLTGAELFTGNSLIVISVLDRRATPGAMLRNWGLVYLGNFLGAFFLAACCVASGQLGQGDGALGAFVIKVAAAKCAIPFGQAVVSGFLCNLLVCTGVWCGLSAKDATGRILGCYLPVLLFVVCGFEHSVANMFYIPAGILAVAQPRYGALAAAAGADLSALGWGNFFAGNLLPVTLGNILGGLTLGALLWYCHRYHPVGAAQGKTAGGK